MNFFDASLQRLQNLPNFQVQKVSDTGKVEDWYEVDMPGVVNDLVIKDATMEEQAQLLAGQVGHWSRLEALARRVADIRAREFRMWKAHRYLERATPPADEPKWKKPADTFIAEWRRTLPDYEVYAIEAERAEEAANAVRAVVEAFRAMRDMIRAHVVRRTDQSRPEFRVEGEAK